MFVTIIALFDRDILIQKRSFRIILALSIIMFLAGVLLHLIGETASSLAGALFTPLLSLLIFRFCRRVFLKRYQREPRDTWFKWANGLGADRFFNIVYFASSIWLELLAMGTTMHMARSGW
jgi:hypothetical protein